MGNQLWGQLGFTAKRANKPNLRPRDRDVQLAQPEVLKVRTLAYELDLAK